MLRQDSVDQRLAVPNMRIDRRQPIKLLPRQPSDNLAILRNGGGKGVAFPLCRGSQALNDATGRFLSDMGGEFEHKFFGEGVAARGLKIGAHPLSTNFQSL